MPVATFRCDGAEVPPEWEGDVADLRSSGPDANLRVALEAMSGGLTGQLPERLEDLIRIAAYVYAGDQGVRRGGTEMARSLWQRTMRLAVPVRDPDFWNTAELRGALVDARNFVSED
ncbi:MAG: hypothetical protein HY875_10615 [Chloroflexi bacterium]|nr:hypothetical protein [Chloroflexota bacterium]